MFVCGPRPTPNTAKVVIYKWVCPWCDGEGEWTKDGERCMECLGYGLLLEAPRGWDERRLAPAPTPPAVMRRPCVDCAYRPGSPEEDSEARPGPDVPFYCHHGMHRVGDGYVETAMIDNGLPLGAMVCAGWWALANGRPLPETAFRDPAAQTATPTPHGPTTPRRNQNSRYRPRKKGFDMTRLWEVGHDDYCVSGNHHARVGECTEEYPTWSEFIAEYGERTPGSSVVFRWDWEPPEHGVMGLLELFYVGQTKAQRWSVTVAVHPDEEEAVRAYLQVRLDYLTRLWAPLTPGGQPAPGPSEAAS